MAMISSATMRKFRVICRRWRPTLLSGLCCLLALSLLVWTSRRGGGWRYQDLAVDDMKLQGILATADADERNSNKNVEPTLKTFQPSEHLQSTPGGFKYFPDDSQGADPDTDHGSRKPPTTNRYIPPLVNSNHQSLNFQRVSNNPTALSPSISTSENNAEVSRNRSALYSALFDKAKNLYYDMKETSFSQLSEKILNIIDQYPMLRALVFQNSSKNNTTRLSSRLKALLQNPEISDILTSGHLDRKGLHVLLKSISNGTSNNETFVQSNNRKKSFTSLPHSRKAVDNGYNARSRDVLITDEQKRRPLVDAKTDRKDMNHQPSRVVGDHNEVSGYLNKRSGSDREVSASRQVISQPSHQLPVVGNLVENSAGLKIVAPDQIVDGIYWSEQVERLVPPGIPELEADQWIIRSRNLDIKSLQPPAWNKCGRPKNAFTLLMDGSPMCARYRSPFDRLVQGEVLSYWLARMLGMDNVPPVSLSYAGSPKWSAQWTSFAELGWSQKGYVALIMWIDEIDSDAGSQVLMPQLLLNAYRSGQALDGPTLTAYCNNNVSKTDGPTATRRTSNSGIHANANDSSRGNNISAGGHGRQSECVVKMLTSLVQWGSMIILDFLTSNYDRVASMQDAAEREKKPSIIQESIRNLRRSKGGDKLWLIDNECGLLDAYELLYLSHENGHRFFRFHNLMLQTMCIFQKRVVSGLRALHRQDLPHRALEKYTYKREPLLKHIENDSSYAIFKKHFAERLDAVVRWIHVCESRPRRS